jgi:hypothetical protein
MNGIIRFSLGVAIASLVVRLWLGPEEHPESSASPAIRPSWLPTLWDLPNPTGLCPRPRNLDWDSPNRDARFPSVQERVCFYMTRWYDPHFGTARQWTPRFSHHQHDNATLEIYWNNKLIYIMETIENHLENDIPFFVFPNNTALIDENWSQQKHWILFICYSSDTKKMCNKFKKNNPILFCWGDQEMKITVHVPIIAKWRFNAVPLEHHHTVSPVPILAPLDTSRHFGSFQEVRKHDIPWEEKVNQAVWRGAMTGIIENGKFPYDFNVTGEQALETCLKFERCRLVYRNHNTTDVDVGFSSCQLEELKIIEGIPMMRTRIPISEQLKYKMLISVEGNDVATGLKWSLLSTSVVLMPPPTKTIFSLEVLLEPWIHYVPLDVDNVAEAIRWVVNNDAEARRISMRATNFMEDLFFHPDAEKDSEDVMTEIANRISALWK